MSVPGLTANSHIILTDNLITEVKEEVFRPMLEIFTAGTGYVYLAGESRGSRRDMDNGTEAFVNECCRFIIKKKKSCGEFAPLLSSGNSSLVRLLKSNCQRKETISLPDFTCGTVNSCLPPKPCK